MSDIYIFFIVLGSILTVLFARYILYIFGLSSRLLLVLLFPIFLFVSGFALRFSGLMDLIDIGYFFTDLSYLLVYTLFSFTFLLGQLKYWKVSEYLK